MAPVTLRVLGAFVSVLSLLGSAPAQSLYQQSLQRALARPGLELLVFDLRSNQTLADTFGTPESPLPVGSLLKPFLAAAYARTHTTFPTYSCPKAGPRYATRLALPQALALSCNAYFLALAAELDHTTLHDLPAPPDFSPRTLIGLTTTWPIAPNALIRAYAALLLSPETPPEIVEGMRLAALTGTAASLGVHPGGVLAKTGTAPCAAACSATNDGWVLAAVPARHPTLLLLVRKRGTNGAATAAAAGPLLTQLKALHAY